MRRVASVSVDLDNQWSYMKTRGDDAWQGYPSYLDVVIPRILEFSQKRDRDLTVFVVGQDAELDKNAQSLAALGASGLEIGNHSFHHEPWLHLKTGEEIKEEINRAGDAIKRATGEKPMGFRGPGFSLSQATIRTLVESGYEYDATTLPTFIGPLARAFYFRRSSIANDDLTKRDKLFGQFSEVFRPVKPYLWDSDGGQHIVEIPVTTMPLIRAPIHGTYLLYLARYSERIAEWYLSVALALCRLRGVQLSFLLHSLDFLGPEDAPGLEFFPGMDMPGTLKRQLVDGYVNQIEKSFEIVSVGEHAKMAARLDLKPRSIKSLA